MYPILAIDFGQKHIGISISDTNGSIATPLSTIHVTKNKTIEGIVNDLERITREYSVKSILVGYPQVFSENQVKSQEKIDKWIEKVVLPLNIPYIKYDESFSTVDAKNVLISLGQHSKKTKDKIDSIAATVFLQEYLNSKNEK